MMSRSQEFLDRVAAETAKYYMKPNARAEIAHAIGFSTNYMSQLFYQCSGIRFKAYLNQVRMMHARMLLKDYHLSIKEIGLAVGYRSISHFSVAYRRYYGVRPSDDRRRM